MVNLTPELLAQLESHVAFWGTLTVNRGEGALFGHGGQLNGFFHHFEFLADALPALVAAAKELDQLRDRLENQRGTISKLREEIASSDEDEGEELAACSKQLDVYAEERAKMIAEVRTLRAEVSEGKSEIKQLSEMLSDSQVDRAYLSEKIDKLQDEAVQLRTRVFSLDEALRVEIRCHNLARAHLHASPCEPLWTEIASVMAAFVGVLAVAEGVPQDTLTANQRSSIYAAKSWLSKERPAIETAAPLSLIEERDQLRSSLADKEEEIRQLSEMLGPSQIDRANLGDQVDQLRAEVERLRGLGLEAVDRAEDYRDYVCNSQEKAMAETKRLRAEIERKP